jgi:hypothetical protein
VARCTAACIPTSCPWNAEPPHESHTSPRPTALPQVDSCKRSMNTFAFVGDLQDNPQISCVYHSEEAENLYLSNPKKQPGLLQPGLDEIPPDTSNVP